MVIVEANMAIEVVIEVVITAIIGKDAIDEKIKATEWSPLQFAICRYVGVRNFV